MEEWGHNAAIDQETVRSAVEAFAKGEIKLPPTKRLGGSGGTVRYALSFKLEGADSTRVESAYSAEVLGPFLGMKPYEIETALAALTLMEEGLATEKEFEKLSSRQAKEVVHQTRRVFKTTGDKVKATNIGKEL